jgi:hypothetical protein
MRVKTVGTIFYDPIHEAIVLASLDGLEPPFSDSRSDDLPLVDREITWSGQAVTIRYPHFGKVE